MRYGLNALANKVAFIIQFNIIRKSMKIKQILRSLIELIEQLTLAFLIVQKEKAYGIGFSFFYYKNVFFRHVETISSSISLIVSQRNVHIIIKI